MMKRLSNGLWKPSRLGSEQRHGEGIQYDRAGAQISLL